MEYAGGGDIRQKIKEFRKNNAYIPEPKIWKYFAGLVKGLNRLHKSGILHRDIKTANIFITKD